MDAPLRPSNSQTRYLNRGWRGQRGKGEGVQGSRGQSAGSLRSNLGTGSGAALPGSLPPPTPAAPDPAAPLPSLRPPGRDLGSFPGARGPVSLVCITESTTIYLRWANTAAVSGGTLTILNDSGGGDALQDAGERARKGTGEQAENSGGNSVGGGDKRGL